MVDLPLTIEIVTLDMVRDGGGGGELGRGPDGGWGRQRRAHGQIGAAAAGREIGGGLDLERLKRLRCSKPKSHGTLVWGVMVVGTTTFPGAPCYLGRARLVLTWTVHGAFDRGVMAPALEPGAMKKKVRS